MDVRLVSQQLLLLVMKTVVVGHGLGKAKEVVEAISKGIDDAKKNLIKVPILTWYSTSYTKR